MIYERMHWTYISLDSRVFLWACFRMLWHEDVEVFDCRHGGFQRWKPGTQGVVKKDQIREEQQQQQTKKANRLEGVEKKQRVSLNL